MMSAGQASNFEGPNVAILIPCRDEAATIRQSSQRAGAGADAIFVYQVEGSPYFEVPKFYLSAYYMEKTHGVLMVLALIGVL